MDELTHIKNYFIVELKVTSNWNPNSVNKTILFINRVLVNLNLFSSRLNWAAISNIINIIIVHIDFPNAHIFININFFSFF